MRSSINVRYNVYAPKAEQNRMTHLKRVTRTVYLLGSQLKLPCGASTLEQMRFLGHVNTKQRCEILYWRESVIFILLSKINGLVLKNLALNLVKK